MSTELQHEFGLAVIKTKSRDSKMGASFRSEENRERCSLPADLGSSGRNASTAKISGKQRTKTVHRDAGNIPAKQNSESEHYTHCDGPWRYCTSTCPSSSSDSQDRETLEGSLLALSQQQ